jgi:hypothetical protein
MNGIKAAVNACWQLIRCRAKIKALHPQQMQGKRKTPPERGWSAEKLEYIISNVAILGGVPTWSIYRVSAPKLAIVWDNLTSYLARYIAARCACVVVCGAM